MGNVAGGKGRCDSGGWSARRFLTMAPPDDSRRMIIAVYRHSIYCQSPPGGLSRGLLDPHDCAERLFHFPFVGSTPTTASGRWHGIPVRIPAAHLSHRPLPNKRMKLAAPLF